MGLGRILVTGASGTLGFNLVRWLGTRHAGCRLRVLLRSPDARLFGDLCNVEVVQADIEDTAAMRALVLAFKPEALVHCAAAGVRPSRVSWFEQIAVNVTATTELFRASCALAQCHFVHVSTGLVYSPQERACEEGDPVDTLHPYGAAKAAADCLLRAGAERLGRAVTVVRPFSFTGLHDGGDRLFPTLLRAAAAGQPLELSPGTQMRDFCAVQDVVQGIGLILDQGAATAGQIVNLGSGQAVSLRATVESVCAQLGLRVDLQFGHRLFHAHEPMQMVASIERARALGWQPRTNLAYAVWELAQAEFPQLPVTQPRQWIDAQG